MWNSAVEVCVDNKNRKYFKNARISKLKKKINFPIYFWNTFSWTHTHTKIWDFRDPIDQRWVVCGAATRTATHPLAHRVTRNELRVLIVIRSDCPAGVICRFVWPMAAFCRDLYAGLRCELGKIPPRAHVHCEPRDTWFMCFSGVSIRNSQFLILSYCECWVLDDEWLK